MAKECRLFVIIRHEPRSQISKPEVSSTCNLSFNYGALWHKRPPAVQMLFSTRIWPNRFVFSLCISEIDEGSLIKLNLSVSNYCIFFELLKLETNLYTINKSMSCLTENTPLLYPNIDNLILLMEIHRAFFENRTKRINITLEWNVEFSEFKWSSTCSCQWGLQVSQAT